MNPKFLIKITILALILNLGSSSLYAQNDFNCYVVHIHDGDTFTCKNRIKIRIWGINTPEVSPVVSKEEGIKNGGYTARDFLRTYIDHQMLTCKNKGRSYKRIVGQCFLNGQDIAIPLLKKGYAKEEIKYSKGYYSGVYKNDKKSKLDKR